MKKIRYRSMVLVLCIMTILFCQGCGEKQTVNADDLNKVNQYIRQYGNGAKEMTVQEAEKLSKLEFYDNKKTGEVKKVWDIVVEYANENKPTVNPDDLDIVNQYIREQGNGFKELTIKQAEDMNNGELLENKKTGVIKRTWQMIVDYIHNAKSEKPASLDYKVVFEKDDISFEYFNNWECTGR